MKRMEYVEIMKMIDNACTVNFYSGSKGHSDTIIQCATQIYIAQMNIEATKKENEHDG